MRQEDLQRFKTSLNSDKVVIPFNNELQSKPKWDVF